MPLLPCCVQVDYLNEKETVPTIVRYSLFGELPLCAAARAAKSDVVSCRSAPLDCSLSSGVPPSWLWRRAACTWPWLCLMCPACMTSVEVQSCMSDLTAYLHPVCAAGRTRPGVQVAKFP